MLSVSRSISLLLETTPIPKNEDLVSLVQSHGVNLDVQVNVDQPPGWEPVADTKSTWTDGLDRIFNFRVGPSFQDYSLRFPLDKFASAIGSSGWNHVANESIWFGFDFDSLIGHADGVGVSDEELESVRQALSKLPYVSIYRSTSGRGLHAVVLSPPNTSANTRKDHAANARSVLQLMSKDANINLSESIDGEGQVLWIWAKRASKEAGSFERLHEATEAYPHVIEALAQVPKNLTHVSSVSDDVFKRLTEVQFDAEHNRIIDALQEMRGTTTVDGTMVVTHTSLLAQLHEGETIKGGFATSSNGTDLTQPNAFMFPIGQGGFRVMRYGKGCSEDESWQQDGKGWTQCLYNRQSRIENIRAVIKTDEVTAATKTTLTLKSGDIITVPLSMGSGATVLTEKGIKTLHEYTKMSCREIRAAAQPWGAGDAQDNAIRLAKEVIANSNVVLFHGRVFTYKDGGYTTPEYENDWLATQLGIIADSDRQHMLETYAMATIRLDIKASLTSNVLPHFRSRVSNAKSFNVDIDGKHDLTHCVNYTNGVWLPETNQLLPHSPRYFLRPSIGIEYLAASSLTTFQTFIDQVLQEPEQQSLLQEMLGVMHVGDVAHQKAFFLQGLPRAGKGVLSHLACSLVGKANSKWLTAADLSSTFGMQNTEYKTLLLIPELNSLDEAQVATLKSLTGGDGQSIQRKFKDARECVIKANWILVSNFIVKLDDKSKVAVTRLKVLVFRKSFAGCEDHTLSAKIEKEIASIAAWARAGYLRFLSQGSKFSNNPHADDTVKQLAAAACPLVAFVEENCIVDELEGANKSDIYTGYLNWCNANGYPEITQSQFTRDLGAAFPVKANPTNTRKIVGIGLKTIPEKGRKI